MKSFLFSPLVSLLVSIACFLLASMLGFNGGSIPAREGVSHVFRDGNLFGGYLFYSGD